MTESYMRVTSQNFDEVKIARADEHAHGSQDWVKDFLAGNDIPKSYAACFSGRAELPVLKVEADGDLPGAVKRDGRTVVITGDRVQEPTRPQHANGELPQIYEPVESVLPKVQPIDWGNSDAEVLEITPLKFGNPLQKKLY